MTDGIEIASGQPAGTRWDGSTFATIVIRVEGETADEARAKVSAFTDEVCELTEAHPGVAVTGDLHEIRKALVYGGQIVEHAIRVLTAQRASRQ